MGKPKANSPPQSVVVRTDKTEGESGVYRCPEFKDNLVVTFDNITTIPELLRYATEKFSSKNYLGYRQLHPDGSRGDFVWFTYKEVLEQSQHVACGLSNLGAKPGDKIGFYSVNTYEWKLGEHACYFNSLSVVSLYDSLGPAAVDYIINHAEIEVVFCSNTVLPKLFAAFEKMETCRVRHVIVFDVSNRVTEFPVGERKRRQTISKEPPKKEAPKKEDEKAEKQRRHTISFASVPSFRKDPSKTVKKEEPKKEEKKAETKKEEPKKEEEKKEETKPEEKKEEQKEGEPKKEKKQKKKKQKEETKPEEKKDEENKTEEKKDEEPKKEENNNNAEEKKEEATKDETSPKDPERKKKKKKKSKKSEEKKEAEDKKEETKAEEKKEEEPKKEENNNNAEEKKDEEVKAEEKKEEEPKKEEAKEEEKKEEPQQKESKKEQEEEKKTETIKQSKTEGATPSPPVTISPPASPAPVPFDPNAPIIPDEFRKKAEDLKITLHLFSDIIRSGKEQPCNLATPKTDDLCSIMYTSGTTGVPKGVLLTHKNLCSAIAGFHNADARATEIEVIYLSYLPLAHIMERVSLLNCTYRGGQIGFYSGDAKKILEDFAVLKPSIIVGAPRVFQRIYDKVMSTVEASPSTKKWLFKKAYEDKQKALKEGKDTPVWNSLVFNKISESVLGGRVQCIVSGSAPLSETVAEFLRIIFTKDVREGYGLTETSAACAIQLVGDLKGGRVGPPLSTVEIKLVDVPELKYLATDKPCPRGEICMKGAVVTAGYYKAEDKTREVIDEDGWFHTGDIGRINEDGTLSIIDRKKNIFKLSIGEYVAPEYLENVYCRCGFVSQCFVYGNSFENCLVAVVVPDPEVVGPWAEKLGKKNDMKELVADPDFKKAVLAEMNSIGKAAKLLPYEYAKDIVLESEPFSVDNELLTPTFKLKRVDAHNKYKSQFEQMYAALNEQAKQAEKEKEQTKE